MPTGEIFGNFLKNYAGMFLKELVFRYTKAQIEDSLYFLEKRGYLNKHGFVNFTLVARPVNRNALLSRLICEVRLEDE